VGPEQRPAGARRPPRPTASAVAAGQPARQVVAPPQRRATAPCRLAGQAAHSPPCLMEPWRAPAPRRESWPEDWGQAGRPRQAVHRLRPLWRSPALPPVAVAAPAAARCLGRTGQARHSAPKGRRSAPPRPRVGRWCDPRSGRWQCWRARRGREPQASAARRLNSDKAGPRQVAVAALPRSCRLAGRATSSQDSSMRGTTSIPPAAAPATARGGRAGLRCRIRGRNQLEPTPVHP
jgi:hypothetical protein